MRPRPARAEGRRESGMPTLGNSLAGESASAWAARAMEMPRSIRGRRVRKAFLCDVIYLCGASCSGKTTVAHALALRLDGFVVSTDVVKLVLRRSRRRNPRHVVHAHTFSAHRRHPPFSVAGLLRHARAHARAVLVPLPEIVDYYRRARPCLIVEGAHLFPSALRERGLLGPGARYFFLRVRPEVQAGRVRRRGRLERTHAGALREIRLLEHSLMDEAARLPGALVVDNSGALDDTVRAILRAVGRG